MAPTTGVGPQAVMKQPMGSKIGSMPRTLEPSIEKLAQWGVVSCITP